MPDISMCLGNGCPLKQTCYRYRAKPNEFRQTYFTTPPYKEKECDYHWQYQEPNEQVLLQQR